MNRTDLRRLAAVLLPAVALAVTCSQEAAAQYRAPPPGYVASYTPVYYQGRAHYYYGGRWFYRDHEAWRWYDREPGYLRDHRGEWGQHWHHWR